MDNYFEKEREAWLESKKGKFSGSDISKLFVPGSREMTEEEKEARPKKILKNGEEGKQYVGGTTVPVLFGVGAITYIRSKVNELITGKGDDIEGDGLKSGELKQLQWGTSYEFEGLRHFEVITGKSILFYGGGAPVFYEYGDYCGCSPDAEVVGEDALVEAKCPYNPDVHTKRLLYKTVEDFKQEEYDYYCQCQCQMRVMNKSFCYFISYDPRKLYKAMQMKIIKVPADTEWQTEFDLRLTEAINLMATMLSDTEKYTFIQ